MQRLVLSEFSSQFSPRISLSKVWEQAWHRAVPDSSKYQGTSAPKRSALYPQIHQSSWTVLLCSWSLWQMQQACKRCPTFFFSKVSGVLSVSSLRNCTCSLPAAWALWSVPVMGCSALLGSACQCLSPGAQCLLLPQDIPAGLCSWELLYAGDFQTSLYRVRNMFQMSYWW